MPDSVCMRRGDRRPVLRVQLALQGAPSTNPLAGFTEVRFKMVDRSSGRVQIDQPATVESVQDRTVSYAWGATDTGRPGDYEAWFVVDYGVGEVQSFPSCEGFRIHIE